ncbi:oxidative damage protection protein [Halorhodospira abdelmalekii]|uniref:oxidative damage protection protein n=1 Tax=Halorhodospira abdelmalekii TaxID=421629 RepID=UPI00190498CE|nr:oxidative damage protection protein [Halorhodospira abdelmalekii]MBK1733761.1 oxidative damage protection protein [Halorhodospira abdelmalekii]
MRQTVHCIKLKQEAEALEYPPYPGELGQRIQQQVSKPAWQMWVQQQTMLINEYRLMPADAQARRYLEREMERFLFGPGSEPPPDYRPKS